MTAQSTSVKYFGSHFSGAPQLSATAGTLTDILDACLVNGIGLQSLTNIVVTSGVAVGTVASSHIFNRLRVVLIDGATLVALNGEKRVTASTTTTFSFDATGVADGTYTGSITAKLAPLGWSIHRTATNKRMYKSTNVASNGIKLRVDDTNTATYWNAAGNIAGTYRAMARVSIAFDDSSIDAYSGDAANWWIKQNSSTGTTARQWFILGDDRGFYINYLCDGGYLGGRLEYFGELANITRPNDAYATIITGWDQANVYLGAVHTGGGAYVQWQPGSGQNCAAVGASLFNLGAWTSASYRTDAKQLARSHTQIGNANIQFVCQGSSATFQFVSGSPPYGYYPSGYGGYTYPNPPDNGLYFAENILVQEVGSGIRGTLPGFAQVLHTRPIGSWQYVIENMPNAPGRIFISAAGQTVGYEATTGQQGEVFLDMLGPWR